MIELGEATSFCALGYHTWRRILRPGWWECIYCTELTEG